MILRIVLLVVQTALLNPVSSQSLNSLISLSEIVTSSETIAAHGNINLIKSGFDDVDESITNVCYLPLVFDFSTYGTLASAAYEVFAATLLALEHLNTGDGSIVPDLEGLHERCPLQFYTNSFDTEGQLSTAIDHVIMLTDAGDKSGKLVPSAILGAFRSSFSIPMSIISSIRGLPQISPASTAQALDNVDQHKHFGRTVPNDDATAISLLEILKSWNVHHLALLHNDDAWGAGLAISIRLIAAATPKYATISILTQSVRFGSGEKNVRDAIRVLGETGYTYFFGALLAENIEEVMTEAYHQGVAGTGRHTWILGDGVGYEPSDKPHFRGSPLSMAYAGTGMLSVVGGLESSAASANGTAFERFVVRLRQLKDHEEDVGFINNHLPKNVENRSIITRDSFLGKLGLFDAFGYDAVVALGLAACELAEESNGREFFTGEELFGAFVNQAFEGATGPVVFDSTTGTRDPASAMYVLTNFVEDLDADVGDGSMKFKSVDSILFTRGELKVIHPFVFNDGTTVAPDPLPDIEMNPASVAVKVICLVLCTVSIGLALGFGAWTHGNKKMRVVRASQPIFLGVICAGCGIMGSAIIPLFVDLSDVDSTAGSTAVCMAFPWMVSIGFALTFSALFTKTYRINQIMKSAAKCKRLALTARDVMKPMLVLLTLNVAVLIMWTAVDPLRHKVVVLSVDKYSRVIETSDMCTSDYSSIFTGILCAINGASLGYALLQAYHARNLSTEFQESVYILMALVFILFSLLMGVPIWFIAGDNEDALRMVKSGIMFAASSSVLLLIFGPKVWVTIKENKERRVTEALRKSKMDTDAAGIEVINTKEVLRRQETELRELREKVQSLRQLQNADWHSSAALTSFAEEKEEGSDTRLASRAGPPPLTRRASRAGVTNVDESWEEGRQYSKQDV